MRKYSRIGLAHLKSHIVQDEIDSILILVALKKRDTRIHDSRGHESTLGSETQKQELSYSDTTYLFD